MKYSKKLKTKFIETLLDNYNEPEADKINQLNEKSLSKELKNIIKNNSNNIVKGSGSGLKLKPIDTSKLLSGNGSALS
jgi:hypothetical protein